MTLVVAPEPKKMEDESKEADGLLRSDSARVKARQDTCNRRPHPFGLWRRLHPGVTSRHKMTGAELAVICLTISGDPCGHGL